MGQRVVKLTIMTHGHKYIFFYLFLHVSVLNYTEQWLQELTEPGQKTVLVQDF